MLQAYWKEYINFTNTTNLLHNTNLTESAYANLHLFQMGGNIPKSLY